jgi:hypothetical protein
MHAHPMPAISLGIILRVGTVYGDLYTWRTDAGELHTSIGLQARGTSNAHIQGPPAALRELAAALLDAANRAEATDDPAHAVAVVEGVAG